MPRLNSASLKTLIFCLFLGILLLFFFMCITSILVYTFKALNFNTILYQRQLHYIVPNPKQCKHQQKLNLTKATYLLTKSRFKISFVLLARFLLSSFKLSAKCFQENNVLFHTYICMFSNCLNFFHLHFLSKVFLGWVQSRAT